MLRQNLHGTADQSLSHRGQRVDLGWADEHVIELAASSASAPDPRHTRGASARHHEGDTMRKNRLVRAVAGAALLAVVMPAAAPLRE